MAKKKIHRILSRTWKEKEGYVSKCLEIEGTER